MADNDGTEPDPVAHDDETTASADAATSDPETSAPAEAPESSDLDDGFDDDLLVDEGGQPPTTKAVRYAQIGLVAAAVLILIIVFLVKGSDDSDDSASKGDKTETTTAEGKKASTKPSWPKDVQGRPPAFGKTGEAPAAATEAKPGVYIWSDFDGWHLWVVNGEGMPAVSGTLTSNDSVQKAVLATPDAGAVDINDKVVTFEFPTAPAVVGMDFNPGFYANDLVITVDGPDGPVSADQVFLGKKSVKAPFPLVIRKEVQD